MKKEKMPERSRQRLKNTKRIHDFIVSDQERSLAIIRTKHGIAAIHTVFPNVLDKLGVTLFQFVYEEESYRLRYNYVVDRRRAKEIAVDWIERIVNEDDRNYSDEWLEDFLQQEPDKIRERFAAFLTTPHNIAHSSEPD